LPHLQKQETVSSMSSGSTMVGGGVGEGGTVRYLTWSTWRAARAPLRRRMPTGQRRGLGSSPALMARTARDCARGCAPRATDHWRARWSAAADAASAPAPPPL
ncbi:hypothetical protein KGM_216014B, partial [Danaus plexippus plexippus]